MNKIIKPISYKKMAESYAEPAYTYKKFTEGYGAGYEFNIYGLKLKNVKIKNVKKDSNEWGEWQSGEFEADIVPGEYQWDADHPLWSVKSPDYAEPASVSGGKVYGIFEDADVRVNGGDIADTLQWEKYDLGDIIGGGWSHTNLPDTLELEEEDRGDYVNGIDKSKDNSNYGYIIKASINLDAEYLNNAIYDAMNPEEDIFWGSDKYEDYDLDDAAEDYAEDFEDTDDEDIGLASDARHPGQWYESKESKGKKLKESYYADVRDYLVNEKGDTITFGDLVKEYKDKFGNDPYSYVDEDDSEVWEFLDNHVDVAAFLDDVAGDYGYDDEDWIDSDEAANVCSDAYDSLIDDINDALLHESKKSNGKRINEYQASGELKNYKPKRGADAKTKKYREDEGQVGDIVKIVGSDCINSALPIIPKFFGQFRKTTYDFSNRPEFKDYKKKGLEKEFNEFKDALGHLGEIVKASPEHSYVKDSFIIKVLNGPSKGKEFEFYPDEFFVVKGKTEKKYRYSSYNDKYGYGTYTESKLNEDSFTSKVRQDIVDINAAKEQVNNAVEVLDKKVSSATNNLVQIALNNRSAIREAQTRFVEIDSPINVSKEGQISENDAKKILRKLAVDRNLRVNAHYSVRDSEGKETVWDFMKSQNPDYQYVFLMEMTGRYTWCNMLFLNKKRGKVDIKNTFWDSYDTSAYNKFYDKEEVLQESNRLTHKIVLKPENSGYRLTYADKLRFHSLEDAQKKLDDLNAQMGSRLAGKGLHLEIEEIPQISKPRNTRTSDPDYENPFEVGDILEGDFGWSMILPAWVEVMSKTNKMVTVRQLKSKVISHDGYGQAGTKMPIPGQYEKDWNGNYREKRCLVKKGYNRTPDPNPKKNYIIDYDGKIFQIWDGEASDFDTYD